MPAMFIIHHASKEQVLGLLKLFEVLGKSHWISPQWWVAMYDAARD